MEDKYRALLLRARNVILVELRSEARDKLPEPTALLLEIDAALGIEDHTWYTPEWPATVTG